MSLPGRNQKDYLHIDDTGPGLTIVARKEDADALAPLFLQYGVSCHRRPDRADDRDALQFPEGMDRKQVEQILEGYKAAKGS
jgi:hypothetical protein